VSDLTPWKVCKYPPVRNFIIRTAVNAQKYPAFRQANSSRDLAHWSLVQGRRLLHHWSWKADHEA